MMSPGHRPTCVAWQPGGQFFWLAVNEPPFAAHLYISCVKTGVLTSYPSTFWRPCAQAEQQHALTPLFSREERCMKVAFERVRLQSFGSRLLRAC
jgi:hypothetical protein